MAIGLMVFRLFRLYGLGPLSILVINIYRLVLFDYGFILTLTPTLNPKPFPTNAFLFVPGASVFVSRPVPFVLFVCLFGFYVFKVVG